MTPKDIFQTIKEKGVKFVDLRFCDTRGKEQHVSVPVASFGADKFESGHFFDGSSTIRNGGPGANQYNALADFVLGRHNNAYQWLQVLQPYLKMRW